MIRCGAPSCGSAGAQRFDGDGSLDLFVGGRVVAGGSRSQLPLFCSVRLVADSNWMPRVQTALSSMGMVSSAVWSDLTGDGSPELALACEWAQFQYS